MVAMLYVILNLDGQEFKIQLQVFTLLLLFVRMDFESKGKFVMLELPLVANQTVQKHYLAIFALEELHLVLTLALINANFHSVFHTELDGLVIKQLLSVKQFVEMEKFLDLKLVMMALTMV